MRYLITNQEYIYLYLISCDELKKIKQVQDYHDKCKKINCHTFFCLTDLLRNKLQVDVW